MTRPDSHRCLIFIYDTLQLQQLEEQGHGSVIAVLLVGNAQRAEAGRNGEEHEKETWVRLLAVRNFPCSPLQHDYLSQPWVVAHLPVPLPLPSPVRLPLLLLLHQRPHHHRRQLWITLDQPHR